MSPATPSLDLAPLLPILLVTAACSTNLRAVNVRTVAWGIGLQLALALFILKFEIAGVRPGYEFFSAVANGVKRFLEFTSAGSQFVFGDLSRQDVLGKVLPNGFVFAFTALPTIIFVSAFFTVRSRCAITKVVRPRISSASAA